MQVEASRGAPDVAFGLFNASLCDWGDSEAQLSTARGPDDSDRLVQECEAERLEREKPEEKGPLAGARSDRCTETELETAHQVVGEDGELLPEVVGLAIARGDRVEGKMLFEFAERFLMAASAGHEVPERSDPEV